MVKHCIRIAETVGSIPTESTQAIGTLTRPPVSRLFIDKIFRKSRIRDCKAIGTNPARSTLIHYNLRISTIMLCKNKYNLPLEKKRIVRYLGEDVLSHGGKLKYSVDFIVPESTPIYAALGGKVVYVKQSSKIGAPLKKYWNEGNRIVIKHRNNEYSAYEHLKYKGAKVKVGQVIKKGQLIGYTGNTGFSYEPHLHFEVFNKPSKDEVEGKTLRINFHKELWKEFHKKIVSKKL